MTGSRTSRGLVYGSARFFYQSLKKIIGPSVRSHPRLYGFVLALREAVKEFLRPHTAGRESLSGSSPAGAPPPLSEPACKREAKTVLPKWLIDEWREIHAIEPQLFPVQNIQFNIVTDFIRPSKVGKHYLDLCELYGKDISHVFMVPWLKKGGADHVTINYVSALSSCGFGKKIVVISTENADSPWAEKLPEGARFIEFGKRYSHLSQEEQEKLLTRLFLQLAPRVIHNINSLLGYNIFIKYGKAVAATSSLYASAFCEDITPEGRSVGYPVCFLPQCFDALTAVFSDNRHILSKLSDIFAFDEKKLFVHYQPVNVEIVKHKPRGGDGKKSLDILWASRLDIQKRPDILIKIAERCKDLPFTFHVYGSPVYGTSEREVKKFVDSFGGLPNVRYYGPFDGLKSLPTENYDIFLYTSQWDGLPNVLLEAASLGLPIVASATGGIPELIRDGETGFVVSPYDYIDGYVNTLRRIGSDRSILKDIAGNALKLVNSKHSWDSFVGILENEPFYCGGNSGNAR